MSDKYTGHGDQTMAGAGHLTIISIVSPNPAVKRGKLYELIIGCFHAAGDSTMQYKVQRSTDGGTGTALTEIALDSDAPAAQLVVADNQTVEPTYTANQILLQVPVNQRATFRWVAVPGGEFMIPATADNGMGVSGAEVAAVNNPEVECDIYWEE